MQLPHSKPYHIRTYTGNNVDVFNPTPDMFCIEDIAHSLANQCRFGGHTKEFYSVAQHCIECSELVPTENKLEALMHDASEAYLLDIPTPVKSELINYKKIEHALMLVLAGKFGFNWPMSEAVHQADDDMLHREWEQRMLNTTEADTAYIKCLNPIIAKHQFIKLYNLYSKK